MQEARSLSAFVSRLPVFQLVHLYAIAYINVYPNAIAAFWFPHVPISKRSTRFWETSGKNKSRAGSLDHTSVTRKPSTAYYHSRKEEEYSYLSLEIFPLRYLGMDFHHLSLSFPRKKRCANALHYLTAMGRRFGIWFSAASALKSVTFGCVCVCACLSVFTIQVCSLQNSARAVGHVWHWSRSYSVRFVVKGKKK